MKKIIASLVVGLIFTSCSITSPLTVTNNTLNSKEGRSETVCVFGFGGVSSGIVLNKNYSVVEAAKQGNITKIGSVDLKVQNFLLFTKNTLIVTGE
jgi:hypothetical protein